MWLLWVGGMRGCSRGGVVAPGGTCMVAARGACMVALGGGMCGIRRDTEIRSTSRRYASYWNAFFLKDFGNVPRLNAIPNGHFQMTPLDQNDVVV